MTSGSWFDQSFYYGGLFGVLFCQCCSCGNINLSMCIFSLTKSRLSRPQPSKSNEVNIENWTKWRLFVNKSESAKDSRVVYGSSATSVKLENQVSKKLHCSLLQKFDSKVIT